MDGSFERDSAQATVLAPAKAGFSPQQRRLALMIGPPVVIAIIDSGVEGSHPVVGGRLAESVTVRIVDDETEVVPDEPIDSISPTKTPIPLNASLPLPGMYG